MADAMLAERAVVAGEHELRSVLAEVQAWRGLPDETSIETWERIAALFHAETGFLRPGKDEPSRAPTTAPRDRQLAWDKWVDEKNKGLNKGLNERIAKALRMGART
jgi:hypothetical protein